jgi:hypothetical protein
MRMLRSNLLGLLLLLGSLAIAVPAQAFQCFKACFSVSDRPDANDKVTLVNNCGEDLVIVAGVVQGDGGRRQIGLTGFRAYRGPNRVTWPFVAGNHTIQFYLVRSSDYQQLGSRKFEEVASRCGG